MNSQTLKVPSTNSLSWNIYNFQIDWYLTIIAKYSKNKSHKCCAKSNKMLSFLRDRNRILIPGINCKMGSNRQVVKSFSKFFAFFWHIRWYFKVLQRHFEKNHQKWQKYGKNANSLVHSSMYVQNARNFQSGFPTRSVTSVCVF